MQKTKENRHYQQQQQQKQQLLKISHDTLKKLNLNVCLNASCSNVFTIENKKKKKLSCPTCRLRCRLDWAEGSLVNMPQSSVNLNSYELCDISSLYIASYIG